MTDRAALLMDLAQRCEKAEGADRELDGAIASALGWTEVHGSVLAPRFQGGRPPGVTDWWDHVPAYTASLDAALSLVPEGLLRSMLEDPRVSRAVAHVRTKSILDPDTQEWSGYAKALPLALCAAALRALASGAPR